MNQYIVATPDQLSQIIRGRRKTLQLTQKDAGAAVGLLTKTISAVENDARRSTVETLFKLLSALDLEFIVQPKSNTESTPGDHW